MKKLNSLKDIYIGSIIKQKFIESSMNIQEFANRINCDRTTVYGIFKRKSIDTERLIRISEALDFDFVNEIYYEKNTLLEKPQKILITIAIDKEKLEKDIFINLEK